MSWIEYFPHLSFFSGFLDGFSVFWSAFTQKNNSRALGRSLWMAPASHHGNRGNLETDLDADYSLIWSSAGRSDPHFPWKSGLELLGGKKGWEEKWMNWDKWLFERHVCDGRRPELDVGDSCGVHDWILVCVCVCVWVCVCVCVCVWCVCVCAVNWPNAGTYMEIISRGTKLRKTGLRA